MSWDVDVEKYFRNCAVYVKNPSNLFIYCILYCRFCNLYSVIPNTKDINVYIIHLLVIDIQ